MPHPASAWVGMISDGLWSNDHYVSDIVASVVEIDASVIEPEGVDGAVGTASP